MAVTARRRIIRYGDTDDRLKGSATHLGYSNITHNIIRDKRTAIRHQGNFGAGAGERSSGLWILTVHTNHQAKLDRAHRGFNFCDAEFFSPAARNFRAIKVADVDFAMTKNCVTVSTYQYCRIKWLWISSLQESYYHVGLIRPGCLSEALNKAAIGALCFFEPALPRSRIACVKVSVAIGKHLREQNNFRACVLGFSDNDGWIAIV